MTNPSSRDLSAAIFRGELARIMQTKGAFAKFIFLGGMAVGPLMCLRFGARRPKL
jgi:hypothetical protein